MKTDLQDIDLPNILQVAASARQKTLHQTLDQLEKGTTVICHSGLYVLGGEHLCSESKP